MCTGDSVGRAAAFLAVPRTGFQRSAYRRKVVMAPAVSSIGEHTNLERHHLYDVACISYTLTLVQGFVCHCCVAKICGCMRFVCMCTDSSVGQRVKAVSRPSLRPTYRGGMQYASARAESSPGE